MSQYQPAANFDDYVTFSIDPSGSLVLTMGDVKNAAPGGGGKLPLVWTSSARGAVPCSDGA